MVVTFFNFYAGLSGLYAVVLTLLLGSKMNLDKTVLRNGVYSFNGLLTGLGMGTFFDPSLVYFVLLTLVTFLGMFLSVTLGGWLYKYKLPHLSIPFVLSFWFVLLPSAQFEHLGLTQRNIYWMNEMYALGGSPLLNFFQTVDSLPLHHAVDIYLRSLSSIFFQSNLLAGLLIAIALLYSSRIFFSLSVVGFLTAYFFAQFTGSETASITYYNIGANYMMVAFAIGGFFLIPSKQSYLWTVILIPITSLVLLFFYKLFGFIQLPIFSLPFSLVVIIFVYFLQMRTGNTSKLQLTPLQHYSPETNLYTYNNNKDRLSRLLFYPLHLPFWGEWTVTQGHDGEYTHLGEWGKAFDFMILDNEGKTYRKTGMNPEDYYCFGKPVVAPADGTVEFVVDAIEDNEIGTVNTVNNWGNSIIIKHASGLYSQVSHLKKNSARVKLGDYVKAGDLLALCGNSGRSPEPHLHFQLQAFPSLGSKTLDYPLSYYFKRENNQSVLAQFEKPQQNEKVCNVISNPLLRKAFDIIPNTRFEFSYKTKNGEVKKESWEAYTDAFNYKYLWCEQTKSAAYYVNDGYMFYFTAFYGDKKSLLYYFFLAAYKVFLSVDDQNTITDHIPLNVLNKNNPIDWLQDIIAPFYNFISIKFTLNTFLSENTLSNTTIALKSDIRMKTPGKEKIISNAVIRVDSTGISDFEYKSGNNFIQATCLRK